MNTSIITKTFHKAVFQLKKHSPEILAVTGAALTIGGTVTACKATLKVNDILDETKETIDKIHAVADTETYSDVYSAEDAKKDLAITYVQTGVKIAKQYIPAAVMITLGVGCMFTSNNILRKRNVALAAAYATVDKGYKEYRNRVIERFGETVDRELKYNLKAEKITETVIDEETGKAKKLKTAVYTSDENCGYSPYARCFDEACRSWENNSDINSLTLKNMEEYFNQKLRSKGYVFLSEIYEELGLPVTEASRVVGWRYDDKNPNHNGDNYIDFGVFDIIKHPANADFINGFEKNVILDFNVDGVITNYMPVI